MIQNEIQSPECLHLGTSRIICLLNYHQRVKTLVFSQKLHICASMLIKSYFFFQFKSVFKASKSASKSEMFSKNILSGGCAGSLSLCFVQSIDYTRSLTRVDFPNALLK